MIDAQGDIETELGALDDSVQLLLTNVTRKKDRENATRLAMYREALGCILWDPVQAVEPGPAKIDDCEGISASCGFLPELNGLGPRMLQLDAAS